MHRLIERANEQKKQDSTQLHVTCDVIWETTAGWNIKTLLRAKISVTLFSSQQ